MMTKYPGQGFKIQNLRSVSRFELAVLHSYAPGDDHLDPPLLLVPGAGVIGSGYPELVQLI